MTESIKKEVPDYGSYNITVEMRREFTYDIVAETFRKQFTAFKWTYPTFKELGTLLDDGLVKAFPDLLGQGVDPEFHRMYGAEYSGFQSAKLDVIKEHVAQRVFVQAMNSNFPDSRRKSEEHPFRDQMRALNQSLVQDVGDPLGGPNAYKSRHNKLPYGAMEFDRWSSKGDLPLFESKKKILKEGENSEATTIYTIDFNDKAAKLFDLDTRIAVRNILVTCSAELAAYENLRAKAVNTAAMVWDAIKFYRTTKQLKDGWPAVYEKFMVINNINRPKTKALTVNPIDLDQVNKMLEV